MKAYIIIFLFACSASAFGQDISLTDLAINQKTINNYVGLIYSGCPGTDKPDREDRIVKDPVSKDEMELRVRFAKSVFDKYYKYVFSKRPDIRKKIFEDLEFIGSAEECQEKGNDCRAIFVATARAYIENLRPSIPACHKFDFNSLSKADQRIIELEIASFSMSYAAKSLLSEITRCKLEQNYRDEPYKRRDIMNGGSRYNEKILDLAQQAINEIADNMLLGTIKWKTETVKDENGKNVRIEVEVKDQGNAFICDRKFYSSRVRSYEYGNYYSGTSVSVGKKEVPVPKECFEQITQSWEKDVEVTFASGAKSLDEANKKKLRDTAVKLHEEKTREGFTITGYKILASASQPWGSLPPEQAKIKNIELARERASNAQTIIKSIPEFTELIIIPESKPDPANPNGKPDDSSNISVQIAGPSSIAPGLKAKDPLDNIKFEEIFEALKDELKKVKGIESLEKFKEYADSSNIKTVSEATFKPFQFFKIYIEGSKKTDKPCTEVVKKP